jgi:ubiquinone/menaquinone biosynthesis C-methylase UbiE
MQHSLLPILIAPDGGSLTLTVHEQIDDEIIEGSLTDALGRVYPIEEGIPRMLPENLLEAQKSEMAARDAQVEAYDRMTFLNWFGKIEIPMTLRALSPRAEDRLLEAGCGTGRMTRILAGQVRELVAIDFSFESLRVNRKKLRDAGVTNVHLVQADLCHLPFQSGAFNRIVSCQVLEHVPDEQARSAAISELGRVSKPQSTLALSAYQHSFFTRCFGAKQGAHEGGIPFFRFTKGELREVLETSYSVQSITGSLVYLYLASCRKKSSVADSVESTINPI